MLNAYVGGLQGALENFCSVVLCGDIVQGLWSTGASQYKLTEEAGIALTYYFSTHGCNRLVSSLPSPALGLELLEAATAAARALLLKKVEAMRNKSSIDGVRRVSSLRYEC